jgi:hypothetical protein
MTTYNIEVLKNAIIEGREYVPSEHAWQGHATVMTCTGKDRRFNSMGSAVKFATECFGPNYRETLRIYEA